MDDTTARDDSFINFDSEDINEKIDNNTTGKKVWRFFKKFFLAVIAIGLVASLVFQIIIISSRDACRVQAIQPIDPSILDGYTNSKDSTNVQSATWPSNYSGSCAEGDMTCLQLEAAQKDAEILSDLFNGNTREAKKDLKDLADIASQGN